MGDPFDWDNFNRPACHVTITAKVTGSHAKVLSAACRCGRPIAGRGKSAEANAFAHIRGWNATYEIAYV